MLPKQRVSRTRRNKRRANIRLRAAHTVMCPNCGNSRLPHAACGNCGYVRPGLTVKLGREQE